MRFIAIDVETANRDRHSICQIGLVVFEKGKEISADSILVDPGTEFDWMNIQIHGIDESQVAGANTFPQIHDWLCKKLENEIVLHHSPFDPSALNRACEFHDLDRLTCRWLDNVTVSRRAWPSRANHKLKNLADDFSIKFNHHDALEDARTAGLILLKAMDATGIDLDGWFGKILRRGNSRRPVGAALN